MKRLVALAAFALFSSATAMAQDAAPQQWEAGKHYFVIDPPQPTQTPGKIEVTEVFSYGCPACNFAHTYVDTLRKHLPANAGAFSVSTACSRRDCARAAGSRSACWVH